MARKLEAATDRRIMWITPDRIVTDIFPFEWNLHRIYYIRDDYSKLWHRAGGKRNSDRQVLSAELFNHPQAYVGHRKKVAKRHGIMQLFTLMPQGEAWIRVSPKEMREEPLGVAMTLVQVCQTVDLKRQMADAYGIRAERQFMAGDEEGANESWDNEINLKMEANALYRDNV